MTDPQSDHSTNDTGNTACQAFSGRSQPPAGYGFFPWAQASWDAQRCPTPHPGGFGPIPLGGDGEWVAAGKGQLAGCSNDLEAVARFLSQHAHNTNTVQAYRKEIERFLLWLGLERDRALSEAEPDDLTLYDEVLHDPTRWAHWYANQRYPRTSPHWRPFIGLLSDRAARSAVSIVQRLYQWLVEQGYLLRNPVVASQARYTITGQYPRQERYLPQQLWAYVLEHIETRMPRQTPIEEARYQRARWVFSALYTLLARASELIDCRQGALFYRTEADGSRQWWWKVVGKYRHPKSPPEYVPIPETLIEALGDYREHLGLARYPAPDENTPMVVSLYPQRDGWRPLHRKAAHYIVKQVCREAAAAMRETDPVWARRLDSASTHWLRHSGISHQITSIPPDELLRLARLRSPILLHTYVATEDLTLPPHAEVRR
ncbi:hypothetical protein CKO15_04585 [Halorhodospira abdelmalekii]|uniref:tyrosine-type recombinase/integrase n=1 Tax=Halorhodospira abdelmalekii TaxID=421629 RepID=UPI001905BF88|nr:hypothetical protein [Halorhodospira abdelmalekii]MBK1734573.1 hypothetical protein [Halorhodospira abdelmalekii]